MPLFQNNFSKKITALVLIFCFVGLTAGSVLLLPRNAQAVYPVHDVVHTPLQVAWEALKVVWRAATELYQSIIAYETVWRNVNWLLEWVLGVLLNLLLHQILAMLTNDIVNWIQNGETPRFLSMDLDDWLWLGVDNAGGTFIDQYLGAGWLCEPFDIEIKIALLDVPTFQEEAKCTLSDIGVNISDFYDDFSTGGWKGWLELAKPQNTFAGAYLLAQDEKTSIERSAQKELEKDMEMGEGYLSPKDCVWYYIDGEDMVYIDLVTEDTGRKYTTGYKDVWGVPSLPEKCQPVSPPDYSNPGLTEGGFYGPCHKKCDILTPASSVKQMADKGIGNYYEQINAQISAATAKAGPYAVYVQAIASALINRVITEGFLWVTDENIPQSGDLGAAEDLPEILNPEKVKQGKYEAQALLVQLEVLKTYIGDLIIEQKANLVVLKSIKSTYENEIIPILDEIIAECDYSYAIWAENAKTDILNNIIPSLNERIQELEQDILLMGQIDSAIILVNNYITKADEWLVVWEKVMGDSSDPLLIQATEELKIAEELAIGRVQEIVKALNDIDNPPDDFKGLTEEIKIAIYDIPNRIAALKKERGDPDFPEQGTLYYELEVANELKEEAEDMLIICEEDW